MDPVTHTLVGITAANAFFRRKVGREAVPILVLASNLPDLDGVVMLTGLPGAVALRRTFGHSLLLLPIWSLLLALLLGRFLPRIRMPVLFGLTLLGAGAHLFFDLINSFGVVLLWPFSAWRPELATTFIVDPVLTGCLALPPLLAAFPAIRGRLVPLSRIGAAAAAVWLLVCAGGRVRGTEILAQEMARSGRSPEFLYLFPEPLGPQRWRGVVREGNRYDLYLVRPFSGRAERVDRVETRPEDPRVARARGTELGRRLDAFFKAPVWQVRSDPSGEPSGREESVEVTAADLRFRSLVLDRPPIFSYCFRVPERGEVGPCR